MSELALAKVRYLLLQIRNDTDPMRDQEVDCFAWALECDRSQIAVHNLLEGAPSDDKLAQRDVVLIGGSGDYSTVKSDPEWLNVAFDCMRNLCDKKIPTFGSCWGFQAIARALGGTVINDIANAELGTPEITLTEAGKSDPVFGALPLTFPVLMGHEDRVVTLPSNAILLASSAKVENQAYRLEDAPCYATQFHPELQRETFLDRIRTYPQYVSKILGMTFEEFGRDCRDVPSTQRILTGFVREVLS